MMAQSRWMLNNDCEWLMMINEYIVITKSMVNHCCLMMSIMVILVIPVDTLSLWVASRYFGRNKAHGELIQNLLKKTRRGIELPSLDIHRIFVVMSVA